MATTKDGRPLEFTTDLDGRRYRAHVDGDVVADAEFLLTAELIVFTHTRVEPEFEGQGVGSALIRMALDDVRRRGYSAVPTCPFVRAFVDRHADEYADLIYRRPDESAAS